MTRSEATRARRLRERELRSRKVRAILASGLVLGVGATLTLASWNDSEYAGAEVEAGFFEIEGSITGQPGSFRSTSADAPHTVSFEPDASQMYPGLSTYALFSVQSQADSLGGTLQAQAPQWDQDDPASLGHYLSYGIRVIDGTTCTASTFAASSEVVVDSGTSLSAPDPAVNEQDLAPDAGSTVHYCLELTLPVGDNNAAQGQSVAPQWQFLGTSSVDE